MISIALWFPTILHRNYIILVLTCPLKLALLASTLFFYQDLSTFLHQRIRISVALAAALIIATVLAGAAYLPMRDTFAERFSSDTDLWYSSRPGFGNERYPPYYLQWLALWKRYIPHITEVLLTMAYYGSIVLVCSLRRLDRISSIVVGGSGYAFLLFAPAFAGLISYDFDNFMKGIVLDNISLSLFPFIVMFAGSASIFLFVFHFIFYSVCALFMYASPRPIVSDQTTSQLGS